MGWPRWVHRVWAFVWGYFWLPCDVCGRWFGGHEGVSVPFYSHTVCSDPKCVWEAVLRSHEEWAHVSARPGLLHAAELPAR